MAILPSLRTISQGDLRTLPASDLRWLASHSCPHHKPFIVHPSCFSGQTEPTGAVIDLECSPATSYTYGQMHEATILSFEKAPYLFCFAYADIKGGKPKVVSLPDFKLYKTEPTNDREVVKKLHEVMSSVDFIISHNISFDVRLAHARFIEHKLPPIKGVKNICTLKLARKVAQFPSNSLKELALFMGLTHKMETSKYLWQKIHINRDKKAWAEMVKYNGLDVVVCREIYHKLSAWSEKPLIK